jgi:hypothetical protein
VLASDREREATVRRLRAVHLEGRIQTDESRIESGVRRGREPEPSSRPSRPTCRSAGVWQPSPLAGSPGFPAAGTPRRGRSSMPDPTRCGGRTRVPRPAARAKRLPAAPGGIGRARLHRSESGQADHGALPRSRRSTHAGAGARLRASRRPEGLRPAGRLTCGVSCMRACRYPEPAKSSSDCTS